MKLPALGRRNWLFVASKTGGDRAAILFSLVASCKANLDDLLPDRWLPSHAEHRWQIDELRQAERQRSREQRIVHR